MATTICIFLGIAFLILSIIFGILKAKSTILISGFNTLTNEEKSKYNQLKLSIDMRNLFFRWSLLLFFGAIASIYVTTYCSIIAIIILVILFCKELHFNAEEAFIKYKSNED